MLKTRNYSKGKQILTVDDLIKASSTLWCKDKRCKSVEFWIDSPVNNTYSVFEKDELQKWLEKGLESYDMWERVEEDREIVFSDKVDNMLDDILSQFAYDYTDSEYHQEELMEQLLHKLKEEFVIEVREDV